MSYDPAADIIDITCTYPGGVARDSTTAEKMARSNREQAKKFALDPRIHEWEFDDAGAHWKLQRRKTCAES